MGAVTQLRNGIARKIEAARQGYDERNAFAPGGGMPTEIPAPEASVGAQDAAVPPDAGEPLTERTPQGNTVKWRR